MPDACHAVRTIEQLLNDRSDLLAEVHRKLAPVMTLIQGACGTKNVVLEDYYGENGFVVLFVLIHDSPHKKPREVVFSIPAILVDTLDTESLLQYVENHLYDSATSAA